MSLLPLKSLCPVFPAGLWTAVWNAQIRFKNKPNLKKPRAFEALHYEKKRMILATTPRYPSTITCGLMAEKLKKQAASEESNPYHVFLTKKMRKNFETHPMMAIFHYNSYMRQGWVDMRGLFYDNDFKITIEFNHRSPSVLRDAIVGTKWEPVLRLNHYRTKIGFCAEANVPLLLKLSKKVPHLVLMAAVVEDRLLHRDALDAIAKLPKLPIMHAQVCHTLNLAGISLGQTLDRVPLDLSTSLATYASSESSASANDPNPETANTTNTESGTEKSADTS